MARFNMGSLYRQTGQRLESDISESASFLRDIEAQNKLTESKSGMDQLFMTWLFNVQRKVRASPADVLTTGDDKSDTGGIADTKELQTEMTKLVLNMPTPESRQAAESYASQLVQKALEQSSLLVSEHQVEYYNNTIGRRLEGVVASPTMTLGERVNEIKALFSSNEAKALLGITKTDSLQTEAIRTVVTNEWKNAQIEKLVSAYANDPEDPMGGYKKAFAAFTSKPIVTWDWGTPDTADDVYIDAQKTFADIDNRAIERINALKSDSSNMTVQQKKATKIRDDFVNSFKGGAPGSLTAAIDQINAIPGMNATEKANYIRLVEEEWKGWIADYTTKPNADGMSPVALWNQAVRNRDQQKAGKKVDGPVASREYARKLLPFGDTISNTLLETWVEGIDTKSGGSKEQDPRDAKASEIIGRFRGLLDNNQAITTELGAYAKEIRAIDGMDESEKERYVNILNNAYKMWLQEYMSTPVGANGMTRTRLWQDALVNLGKQALGEPVTGSVASEDYAKSLVPFNNPMALEFYDTMVSQLIVAREAGDKVSGAANTVIDEINKLISSRASSLSAGEGKIAGAKEITSADLDSAYVYNGKVVFGRPPAGAVPLVNVVGSRQMDAWRNELQNIAASKQKMAEELARQAANKSVKFDTGNIKSFILQNKNDGAMLTKAQALNSIIELRGQIPAGDYQELEKWINSTYDNDKDPRVKRAINDVKLSLGTGKDASTRADDFELRLVEILDKTPTDQWDKAIEAAKTGFIQEVVVKSAKDLVLAINGRQTDLGMPYSQPLDIWFGDWVSKIKGGSAAATTRINELKKEFSTFHGAEFEDVTVDTTGPNIRVTWQGRKFEPYIDSQTERIGYQEIGTTKDKVGNVVQTPTKDFGSDIAKSPGAEKAATLKEQYAAQITGATSGYKKTDPGYFDSAYKAIKQLSRQQDAPRDPAQLEKYLYEKAGITGDIAVLVVASAMVDKGYDPIGVYDYAERQNISPAAMKAIDGMFQQKPKATATAPTTATQPVPTAPAAPAPAAPKPASSTPAAPVKVEPQKYDYSHVVSPNDAGVGWAYKHGGWKNMTYLIALKRIGSGVEKTLNEKTIKNMTGADIAGTLIAAANGNKTILSGILADLLVARYGGTDKGQLAFSENDGIIKKLREALK